MNLAHKGVKSSARRQQNLDMQQTYPGPKTTTSFIPAKLEVHIYAFKFYISFYVFLSWRFISRHFLTKTELS